MTIAANFVWKGHEADDLFMQNGLFRERTQMADRQGLDTDQMETVVFLTPMGDFSDDTIAELRDLGYEPVDASALALEIEHLIPNIRDRYVAWGGIRHLGIARYLVARALFPGEELLLMDTDMIRNFQLSEIQGIFGPELYFLDGSSCLAHIPGGSEFLDVFANAVEILESDHLSFNSRYWNFDNPDDVFDPLKTQGSDQAIVLALLGAGDLKIPSETRQRLETQGWSTFANWLTLEPPVPVKYERRLGTDFLSGRRVLVSHLSNDTCRYFGQFILQERLLQEGLTTKDMLPSMPPAYLGTEPLTPTRERLHLIGEYVWQLMKETNMTGSTANPFSRASVAHRFYIDGDLAEVCCSANWGRAGVFA